MSIGKRLLDERKRMGWSQEEMASAGGVSAKSQWGYEHDRRVPDANYLAGIEAAGADIPYVITGEQTLGVSFESGARVRPCRIPGFIDQPEWVEIDVSDYIWVPVLNVQAQGGDGRTPGLELITGYNAYRRSWLNKRQLMGDDLVQVRYVGESMYPELHDGDTLLVSMSEAKKQITGGDIYVVRLEGELIVKYLAKLPGNRIQVSSANPAFPPFEIGADELSTDDTTSTGTVTVLGRVVHQGRDR